ncbi:MAG: hypothetical protein NTX50_03985 [Candidatus Sumerlaeota bacterium]|nr:hypothetical protein [Candidatus Sumerlaeota bacterium]
MFRIARRAVITGLCLLIAQGARSAEQTAAAAPATTAVIVPKKLSANIMKGLSWLVEQQQADGGWSQGEESAAMGASMAALKDKSNVADTCMALLALTRSGSSPKEGDYRKQIVKGLNFVCSEIEKATTEGMFITATRGTRVQLKIGQYIDTFLAANVLAETLNQMPDDAGHKRVAMALDKVMDKIEKNQQADGTWSHQGWAGDLSQSLAARAINVAADNNVRVDEKVRQRAEQFANQQYDSKTGDFKTGGGSAGVKLYSAGASINAMARSAQINAKQEAQVREKLSMAASAEEKKEMQATLERYSETKKNLASARASIIGKTEDARFVSGFGSNGGEEFLSYLNIGESLLVTGGDEWKKWDDKITANLNQIQNGDGTWTGHHCITGRTFCTSAALLVLMLDRTPAGKPLRAQIKGR